MRLAATRRWGYWPAVGGTVQVRVGWSCSPISSLTAIKAWTLAYVVAMFASAAVFGAMVHDAKTPSGGWRDGVAAVPVPAQP